MRSELFISMLSAVYSAPNVSEIEATLLEESMKKFLIGLGITVAVLVILGIVFRGPLMMMAGMAFMQPDHSFADDKTAPAPDYANPEHWAALPELEDSADVVPNGVFIDPSSTKDVDVFFIHPTTYVSSDHWNQPLTDETANKMTDDWVMRDQASVFNGCCQVYAPRYRQATLYSFQDQNGDGGKALELAYQDVRAAFNYFISERNNGRPFIIAGHSQGAFHADRLLKEAVAGKPLQQSLVAAYPIGFSIDGSNGIDVCTSAEQTGCQVSWNTNTADAMVILAQPGDICVNPITWTADATAATPSANLGSISFGNGDVLEQNVTGAQCLNSQLLVEDINSDNFTLMPFGPGNYHMYDYSFFHMNIRANARARVSAYLQAQQSTQADDELMRTLMEETGA